MADRLIQLFANVLDIRVDTLSDETSPENTPRWDSVAALELVVAIEDEFSVRLSTREIMSMHSIGIAKEVLRGKGVADV